jgi:MraZ protein
VAYADFQGSFPVTIEKQNRLLVPAAIRKAMVAEGDGGGFSIKLGLNDKPWFYARNYYKELTRRRAELNPDELTQDADQLYNALVTKLDWDKAGRIVLSQEILSWAGVGEEKDVLLNGMGDRLELWTTADWAKRKEELLARRNEIAEKRRQLQRVVTDG